MSFRSEPIKKHIGEVVHVDHAALLEDDVAQRCLALLEERGVLVFPRLGLTDEEQVAFTDRLGSRVQYNKTTPDGRERLIYKVTFEPEYATRPEYVLGTFFWHLDDMTSDHPPPKATLLTARRIAPKGGQTEFASTFAAYENLPDEDKQDIANLRAVHSLSASLRGMFDPLTKEDQKREDALAPTKVHPIVWRQKSGRTSLVIGTTTDRVVGMPLPEGRALLERLLQWTVQPAFVYRHEWQEGDLVIWNNCGTLHRVIPYDRGAGRIMNRTTVAGVEMMQ